MHQRIRIFSGRKLGFSGEGVSRSGFGILILNLEEIQILIHFNKKILVYLIFSYHNCSYQPEIATNDGSSRIFRTSNILRPRKSEPIHQDSPTQFPRSVSQKLHVGRSIENLQHVGCKKNFQTRKTEPTHQGFLTGPIKKKSELETRT